MWASSGARPAKRSKGSGIGNGPISTDASVNYTNVQNQANGAQFRDGTPY
ncbi:hypothetical protein [Nocardioides cynanchi]|nr:hypothetical protein [Nocardioides cynanchi]